LKNRSFSLSLDVSSSLSYTNYNLTSTAKCITTTSSRRCFFFISSSLWVCRLQAGYSAMGQRGTGK